MDGLRSRCERLLAMAGVAALLCDARPVDAQIVREVFEKVAPSVVVIKARGHAAMKRLGAPTVRASVLRQLPSQPLPLPRDGAFRAGGDTGAGAYRRGLCGWRPAVLLLQHPR